MSDPPAPKLSDAGGRSGHTTVAWLKANPPLKVASVYLASSMAGLGQVDLITARLGAPEWAFSVAVVIAVIGLVAVILLAASLKRGVSLGRFVRVCVGGMALGWVGLALVDNLADRDVIPNFFYSAAVFIWLIGFPVGLSIALLWPRKAREAVVATHDVPEAL